MNECLLSEENVSKLPEFTFMGDCDEDKALSDLGFIFDDDDIVEEKEDISEERRGLYSRIDNNFLAPGVSLKTLHDASSIASLLKVSIEFRKPPTCQACGHLYTSGGYSGAEFHTRSSGQNGYMICLVDPDLHRYPDYRNRVNKRFDTCTCNICLDQPMKRKAYMCSTNSKKCKNVNTFIPLLEYTKELGEPSDLELKTNDSFIVGNLLKTQSEYNFILAVFFALAGNYSYILNFDKDLNLPLVDRMISKMMGDHSVYAGDGYKDIIVRRRALNDIFATVKKNESTPFAIHSEIITRVVYGREAYVGEGKGVSQVEIRSLFSYLARYKHKYGIKHLGDINDTEEYFQFRIGNT